MRRNLNRKNCPHGYLDYQNQIRTVFSIKISSHLLTLTTNVSINRCYVTFVIFLEVPIIDPRAEEPYDALNHSLRYTINYIKSLLPILMSGSFNQITG